MLILILDRYAALKLSAGFPRGKNELIVSERINAQTTIMTVFKGFLRKPFGCTTPLTSAHTYNNIFRFSTIAPVNPFPGVYTKESASGKKKLIIISLDWTRPKDPPLSIGHASILASLQHHGIETFARSWAVNSPTFSPHPVRDFIMLHSHAQTAVAIGAFVWNEKAIQSILTELKLLRFPGRIIIGGPQVSYVKKDVERFYPQADVFIRGYAENALVKLIQSEERFPSIRGVHYAGKPDLGLSAVADLEGLISPFLTGLIPPQRFIRWETQRGCPFRCAFCQHRESDVTMKRRQLSFSRIIQEAEWIGQNPIIQDISVLDNTFNSGPNYLDVLDKLIEVKYKGKIAFQCRIEMIKKEFLDKIVQLSDTAEVVLEFGLQTIHHQEQAIIDRPNNMKLVEKNLTEIHNRNIKCEVSLIFGLPSQTLTSFKQTIDFCLRHKVPTVKAFPLMLLRGTPLYDRKSELGLVESYEVASPDIDRLQVDIPHVVSSPSFTYEEWKEMAAMAACLEKKELSSQVNEQSEAIRNIVAS
ncbi:7106_t:CDS:1 [Paraglomus occultum]|uniref:7106_t:CDS:1 n=1 Tax=Paraglomus occultum TaxID=144539 RepID=A0A9N8WJY4_9GLOM|nr:7106_t:CDS:1 [Paraglomus occultum]